MARVITGAPVTSTLMGLGAFPASSDQWLGMLGMHGTYEANYAMNQADLIVALGTLLDDITTQGYRFPRWPQPQQALVHVYPDHAVVGQHFGAQWPIVADPIDIMSQLIDCEPGVLQTAERKAWQQALLETFGCDEFQGFLRGRSMPATEASRLLHVH